MIYTVILENRKIFSQQMADFSPMAVSKECLGSETTVAAKNVAVQNTRSQY